MPIAINGTGTITGISAGGLPDAIVTPAELTQPLTSGTAVNSTSGTSIDFTGIPSWVKRINVMFNAVSTNGASNWLIQIGDSGGIENTGYVAGGFIITSSGATYANYTTGYGAYYDNASYQFSGNLILSNVSGNIWVASYTVSSGQALTGLTMIGGGTKTLSATLDRVRITTANGTDTFDNGSINILYE